MSTGTAQRRRVWRTIRPSRSLSVAAILLASASLICAIGLIATSAWLISRASQQPPILYLTVAVVSVRAFGIGRGVFRYVERLVSHSAAMRGLTNLRVELVDSIARAAPAGVRWLRPGDAVRRLVDDVDAVSEYGLRTLYPSATAVLVGLAVVGLVAWLVPLAAVILLVALLVAGIVAPALTQRVTRAAAHQEMELSGDLAAELSALFRANQSVLASGQLNQSLDQVRSLTAELRESDSRKAAGLGMAAAVSMLAQGLALVGVILVTVPAVTSGALAGVNLAVVVLIPLVAFEIVAPLGAAAVATARADRSAVRLMEVLDAQDPIAEPVSARSIADGRPLTLTLTACVPFWPAGPPLTEPISAVLEPGSSTAIIGRSGVGKSTLAAALVKFAEHQGQIRLGDVDYQDLTADEVRRHVLLSEQAPHIFDNTLAENVRFAAPSATDSQLRAALERAQLGEWIATLPRGIDTPLGEHGTQVSGGQRQRIALARALLSDVPIVLFDEPTEHLDVKTATALVDSIVSALGHRTIVFLTHDETVISRVTQTVHLTPSVNRFT